MSNEYKIQLGAKVDTSDIRKQIEQVDNKYKVKIGVDLKVNDIKTRISEYNKNTNNTKLKLGVKVDTDDIKRQINKLDIGNTGKGVAIPINTESLEKSLIEVKGIITDIKNSLGTLDGGDMKSLLSSVNQIATALDKAADESNGLVKSLNELSKKDFSVNVGLDLGKKGNNNMIAYGRAARKQVIPELEKQAAELEELLGGQKAAMNKLTKQGNKVGFDVFTDFTDFNSESAIKKMEALEKYINSMKKLAAMDNIKLDGFNEIHKDATELINDIAGVENAVDKASDVPEKLKNLFGGGVDGENLSRQLDSIVADLQRIGEFIGRLDDNNSIDDLTLSFNNLAETLNRLMTSADKIKRIFDSGLVDIPKTAIDVESNVDDVVQAEERKQQAFRETADAAEQMFKNKVSIGQFDDDISDTKELNVELKKLKDLARQIGQLDFKIVKSDYKDDINQVREFERQLELLKIQYNETLNSLNGKDIDIGSEITKEFTEARNKIAEFEAKIADTKAELAENIKLKIDTDIANNLSKVHSDFDKLSDKTDELQRKLDLLDNIKIDLDDAKANNDIEGLIDANERYVRVLKEVEAQLKINKRANQNENDLTKLNQDKANLSLAMKNWLKDNSAAAKKFGSVIRELQARLESCDNVELGNIKREFKQVREEARLLGKNTQTFGDRLKTQFQRYSAYLSVAEVFMYVSQGLKDMFDQVVAIDSAMTELKKVTNETEGTYNKFLSDASSKAKELGTTIDGLVESTADFARLGYGFKDSQGLAEVANIYAVVGDDIDSVETATQSLISTLTAFKDEAGNLTNSDFALSIVDKMNEVSNNFAISSGGIGEALQRSASSMMAANNSLDETIALITAAM